MNVRFWGTRGSIAVPGERTTKYGGNTSCVEIRAADGTVIVLDCGTGARELGLHLLNALPQPMRLHVFIGHTHWDHIQGFPFFGPAFLANSELNIYAPSGFQRRVEDAIAGQMQYSYFPITLRDLRSRIHFNELEEGFFRVGDLLVQTQYLNHTAPTLAYRISGSDATVAYVTDHEPFWKPSSDSSETVFRHPGDQRHVAFLKGADLIIHDAQYSDEEYSSKVGWGHSTVEYATDVALAAGSGRLALFHHDPAHDDAMVGSMEATARARADKRGAALDVFAAAEGLELDVRGSGSSVVSASVSALRRPPIAGGRVLVVSSIENDVATIGQMLAEDNLVPLLAPNKRIALSYAPEVFPDLAIIDARLPDGEGAELIQPLRESLGRPDLPIILLTEGPGTDGEFRISDTAATDCLAKPFNAPMMRTRVLAWLTRTLMVDNAQPGGKAGHGASKPPMTESVLETADRGSGGAVAAATYADMLAGMPLFQSLERQQLLSLVARATERVTTPGNVLVQQGEPSDFVYVVLSGQVRIVQATFENPLVGQVLGELGYGEIFGEVGILIDQPGSATAVAVERTRCLALSTEDFLQALRNSPGLANAVLRVLALRLYNANRLLSRYAPDPLTGLPGRRAFHDHYQRLAAGSRRRRSGAILLLLDVLQLRTINDRFGYVVGDEVLRAVADALMEASRTTDLVARYGGDEFAVFLVDAGPVYIQLVKGRVQEKLADLAVRRGLPLTVECSLGAASSNEPPETADELLREADADMHRKRG